MLNRIKGYYLDSNHKIRVGRVLVFLLVFCLLGGSLLSQGITTHVVNAADPWPDSPPAEVCSNSSVLDGPSTAPSGAVTVAAGDDSSVNLDQANTTYWFAPGTHTLASGAFSNIIPGNNSTYIGAPGAILDGQNDNQYGCAGSAAGVTIECLT